MAKCLRDFRGVVDDWTLITIMDGGQYTTGRWYESDILAWMEVSARMMVYDVEKNTLDILI